MDHFCVWWSIIETNISLNILHSCVPAIKCILYVFVTCLLGFGFKYLVIKHMESCTHPNMFLVVSSGAGVLWQCQQSPVHCSAGLVGEVYWQTRNFGLTQASCSVAAGHGCTVRHAPLSVYSQTSYATVKTRASCKSTKCQVLTVFAFDWLVILVKFAALL